MLPGFANPTAKDRRRFRRHRKQAQTPYHTGEDQTDEKKLKHRVPWVETSALSAAVRDALRRPKLWRDKCSKRNQIDDDALNLVIPTVCSTAEPSEINEDLSFQGELDTPRTEVPIERDSSDDVLDSEGACYDFVDDGTGSPLLVPAGWRGATIRASDLPEDAVVHVRVFRFFEDKRDANQSWERELRNVNSGSLLWLPIHLQPKMHSSSGAKYGSWFMVHHVKVVAKYFNSGYFMAEDGCCPFAKTFGVSRPTERLVSGKTISGGYYWFVTPFGDGQDKSAKESENLGKNGWAHVHCEGPYCGNEFLQRWIKCGSSLDAARLQELLDGLQH